MPWSQRLALGIALAAAPTCEAAPRNTAGASVSGPYVNLGDGQPTAPALDLDHADWLRIDTGAAAETGFGLGEAGLSPATPALPQAPDGAKGPARTYAVFFDWDRADLTPRARRILAQAAASAARLPLTRIEVSGYTDLSGSVAYTGRLSARRAQNVAAELVRDGVPGDEIEFRGLGDGKAAEKTKRKRRLEIVLR